jgi:aspartate aminotransferase
MFKVSKLAETLIPSEIIKLGNEINEQKKKGAQIYNFTIGDFDPAIFPIPLALENEIVDAYRAKRTNYPPANGISELRESVSLFIKRKLGLDYPASDFLISGGGRPLIYAAYRTICDQGDKIIYPVPSWNNNHYTHFVDGEHVCLQTKAENHFLPTAEEIIPHLKGATLLALCSPLNPTGTAFNKQQLTKLCQAVVDENKNRAAHEKPLYILYDQIYWTLTYGETVHYDPVSLLPELRNYTIYIDGISKAFCATGVRVGWAFGPTHLIDKMKGILSHIGAWSPMAEQVAVSRFLEKSNEVDQFLDQTKNEISSRLEKIYQGFMKLKNDGYPVDCIAPSAAMYLAIRFSLKQRKKADGQVITSTEEMSNYILKEANLAVVPFSAFGAEPESEWYRLSVGTCRWEEIEPMLDKLKAALDRLS